MPRPVDDTSSTDEKHSSPENTTTTFIRAENAETFAEGANEQFYRPIEKYEGAHRYDPSFQWSETEEKQLIRKVDHPTIL